MPARSTHAPLTPEQRDMVAGLWDAARSTAWWFAELYPAQARRVDFEGAAAEGLCHAAQTWRAGGKASWRTHGLRRVRGACLDALRSSGLKGYGRSRDYRDAPDVVSLDSWFMFKDGVSYNTPVRCLLDLLVSDEEPVGWELESYEEVRRLSHMLTPAAAAVIRFLYCHAAGRSMRGTAALINRHETRVSQIRKAALAALRRELEEEGK